VEYSCWSWRKGCLRGAIWSASPFAWVQASERFIQRLSLGDVLDWTQGKALRLRKRDKVLVLGKRAATLTSQVVADDLPPGAPVRP